VARLKRNSKIGCFYVIVFLPPWRLCAKRYPDQGRYSSASGSPRAARGRHIARADERSDSTRAVGRASIVDNKAGGGIEPRRRVVAKVAPDGYTITDRSRRDDHKSDRQQEHLVRNERDLGPSRRVTSSPLVVAVIPRCRDFDSRVIAEAKREKSPASSTRTSANGSLPPLGRRFSTRSPAWNGTHPYKSGGLSVQSVLAGPTRR